ncbi:MAG TPA: hypothetical protein VMU16_02190 [Candidatus Binataceae bacterium]|nr:hypothetical protein [Candidatus Binataceae bacterium]
MRPHGYRAAILAAILCLASAGCTGKPGFFLCAEDSDISASERTGIEEAAMRFVRTISGGDPAAAWPQLTAGAQHNLSRENLIALVRKQVAPLAPFKDFRATHAYLVRGVGDEQQVVCMKWTGSTAFTNVVAAPVPEQAHAVVEAASAGGNTAAFVLWMLPEGGEWRVKYFYAGTIAMAGKPAEDFQALARQQEERGNRFNAYVLYTTALDLASRGPNVVQAIDYQVWDTWLSLQPPELKGRPPHLWQYRGDTFHVMKAGAIVVDGKIYLQLTQVLSPWPGDEGADARNRALIAAFAAAHPEYSGVFAGIAADAIEAGGDRSRRTIAEAPLHAAK